jgi:phospholipid/cholesterol/gamma-HCH transport system substrate-binding protein
VKRPISPFKLGLFVLGGLALGLGVLIWIGVTTLFEQTRTYASIFNYSIEGLQLGAPVQRLGVKVGQVAGIHLTGKGKSVLVVVTVDKSMDIDDTMYLQLSQAGLTGQKYLAIKSASSPVPRPEIPDVKYPVLPNRPGELTKIMDQARKVADRLANLDIGQLVDQVRSTVSGAESLVNDRDLRRTIANLRDASADVRNMLNGLAGRKKSGDWLTVGRDIAAAIADLRKTSEKLERMIGQIPTEAPAQIATGAREMVRTGERAAASLDRGVQRDLSQLQDTLDQANRLLRDMEQLVRSLRREPGEILERRKEADPFAR